MEFTTKQLTELIYDKLADNDDYEQFEASITDQMMCDAEKNIIGLLIGNKQYKLTLEETDEIWQ